MRYSDIISDATKGTIRGLQAEWTDVGNNELLLSKLKTALMAENTKLKDHGYEYTRIGHYIYIQIINNKPLEI